VMQQKLGGTSRNRPGCQVKENKHRKKTRSQLITKSADVGNPFEYLWLTGRLRVERGQLQSLDQTAQRGQTDKNSIPEARLRRAPRTKQKSNIRRLKPKGPNDRQAVMGHRH